MAAVYNKILFVLFLISLTLSSKDKQHTKALFYSLYLHCIHIIQHIADFVKKYIKPILGIEGELLLW